MSSSRLLILLVFGMLLGEVPLSGPSARDRLDPAEKGHIGISASYKNDGDTTTITIAWQGCNEKHMLIVDLESWQGRSYLIHQEEATTLFGWVLIRSAGVTGSATFSYKRSGLVGNMDDCKLLASVYLTDLIEIVYTAGDASFPGRGTVIGRTKLTSADCSDDFQVLCKDPCVAKAFFPKLSVFPRKGAAEGSWSRSVPDASVTGFLKLEIEH